MVEESSWLRRCVPDDPNEPGDEECMILDPNSAQRLFGGDDLRASAPHDRANLSPALLISVHDRMFGPYTRGSELRTTIDF